MMYIRMSEAVEWKVMPWEWGRAPEWWMVKMGIYFDAVAKLAPVIEAKRRWRAQQNGN